MAIISTSVDVPSPTSVTEERPDITHEPYMLGLWTFDGLPHGWLKVDVCSNGIEVDATWDDNGDKGQLASCFFHPDDGGFERSTTFFVWVVRWMTADSEAVSHKRKS